MNNAQENEIAHAILTRAIDLRRFAAGQVQQVLRLLRDMSDELRARLARDDLTEYGRRDLQRLFSQANETITGYYADIDSHMADQLLGLGRSEADFTAGAMDRAFFGSLGVQLPTEGYFASLLSDNLIMGAPSAAWWDRQAGDAAFRFANDVRLGLAQAETVDQITRRVRDSMQPAIEGNARALVQTSVQQVSADARRATFKRNEDIVEGIQQISTLDSHTSLVCVAYSGATFTLDGDPIPPTTLPYNGGVPRHFNCLPGDCRIATREDVTGCSKRWFDGNVVILKTASGRKFTSTPNHPVLTNRGWVAAGLVNVGGHVVSDGSREWGNVGHGNSKNVPTEIHDFTEAWLRSRQVRPVPVPLSAEDFHGDGVGSKVAIVYSDGLLPHDGNASGSQHFGKLKLVPGLPFADVGLGSQGGGEESFPRNGSAPDGVVGGSGQGEALVWRRERHAGELLFAPVPGRNSLFSENPLDNNVGRSEPFRDALQADAALKKPDGLGAVDVRAFRGAAPSDAALFKFADDGCFANVEEVRHLINGFSGEVFFDQVVDVQMEEFHGFVYNLETVGGWYTAEGIVTHNCRSVEVPLTKDLGLGTPSGTRASDLGQINADTTMTEFIRMRGPAFADQLLGVGRAQLFLDGKITLTDLLDQSGRPLSLKDLNELAR